MKILIPVDGSEYTRRMLAFLAAHDQWMGPDHRYTVLTVVPALPPRAAAVLDRDLVQSYYEDEAEKVFQPIRGFFEQHKLAADFVRKTGHAGAEIAKLAEGGQYDLIVMGSRGHGALSGLVLGSVTTKVIAHCTTPVLLVR